MADIDVNYDEAAVPAYELPDPLRFVDGGSVRTAADWPRRRAEILELFTSQVYGRMPAEARASRITVDRVDRSALRGLATRYEVLVELCAGGPVMRLCVWIPNAATTPVPAFLGLNFAGIQATHPDPGIALSPGWVQDWPGLGLVDHRPGEASRGMRARRWPVEMVLARGYALATACYGDIEPDSPEPTIACEGVRARLPVDAPESERWGAVGAWAWGLSRAVDALLTLDRIDPSRIAVVGHSRLGKTALWAAANDPRIALAVSNNSGCTGASIARRCYGERTARTNQAFPHWYCGNYRRYDHREHDLPVDQHELLALIAPRPVYVASAVEDRWADPRGEFLACVHADPVYRLLGSDGFAGVRELPSLNVSVGGRIGYHIRPGEHDQLAVDWWHFLDFADRNLVPR